MENDNLYARVLMTNGIVNQTVENSIFVANNTLSFVEFGSEIIIDAMDEIIVGFCKISIVHYFCSIVFPLHIKETEIG